MTAQEIADRLLKSDKDVTPARVRKLRELCHRMGVDIELVLPLLPADARGQFLTPSTDFGRALADAGQV